MSKVLIAFGVVILAILLVFLVPFLIIWSINTLFPVLAIQYTLDTWLAVVILMIFAKEASVKMRK